MVFRIGASADSDLFGVWSTAGDAPDAAASPLWRVDLPADGAQARQTLTTAEATLATAEPALAQADRRLTGLSQMSSQVAVHVSASGAGQPLTEQPTNDHHQPEVDLALLASGGGPVATWQALQQRFDTFVQQIRGVAALQTHVETSVDSQPVARSTIGQAGDLRTCWLRSVDSDQAALHERSVALVLQSRVAMLRKAALVARGALLVSTTGALGPLAIPAILRFIDDVGLEFQEN
jgi:hypothetical protein